MHAHTVCLLRQQSVTYMPPPPPPHHQSADRGRGWGGAAIACFLSDMWGAGYSIHTNINQFLLPHHHHHHHAYPAQLLLNRIQANSIVSIGEQSVRHTWRTISDWAWYRNLRYRIWRGRSPTSCRILDKTFYRYLISNIQYRNLGMIMSVSMSVSVSCSCFCSCPFHVHFYCPVQFLLSDYSDIGLFWYLKIFKRRYRV